MTSLVMIVAQKPAIPFIIEELTEHGYQTYGCNTIQQSLDTLASLNPHLILIVDHFIEGLRDPLEIYLYVRHTLMKSTPIVLVGFRYLPADLVHLDISVFDLLHMDEAMNFIYQTLQ